MTFGWETWTLTNTDMASSEGQQVKFSTRRVGVSRRDNLLNEVKPNQVVM